MLCKNIAVLRMAEEIDKEGDEIEQINAEIRPSKKDNVCMT